MILKFESYRTTKNRLWNAVRPMSRAEFNALINPIIEKCRGISLDDAKCQRFLKSEEVIVFLDKIGYEKKGAGKLLVIDTEHTDKYILRQKIPYISTNDFNSILYRIISMNRKMDIGKAKYRRYLMSNEVTMFLKTIGEKFSVDD